MACETQGGKAFEQGPNRGQELGFYSELFLCVSLAPALTAVGWPCAVRPPVSWFQCLTVMGLQLFLDTTFEKAAGPGRPCVGVLG